ncbi:hypothetical protein [Paenibacillus nasutitermitis]|uniref:Aldouronate transport system substrate-binding protein n=1 Tax=Paenibacillus nasutitermitis TaxID=1652958 RepID=A0A916ZIB8_9BACL|nr:hypothetical protein [Paenibacillus nasutitermitis]GGD98687.1 hypothetical protein GCM10010911_66890 [Paenibacillus nasutitermitis]
MQRLRGRSGKSAMSLLLALVIMAAVFAGCAKENKPDAPTADPKEGTNAEQGGAAEDTTPLEYSFYQENDTPPAFANNPNDVLTPIVEERFHVKVSKVLYNQGSTFKERFNMLLATNDLPDVIYSQSNASIVANSGQYAEMGPLMEQYMPNLMKYAPKETWRDALFNGKMFAIPAVWVDTTADQYKDDIYAVPNSNWGLLIREDILDKLGYKYTPLKEIEKNLNDSQAKPQLSDFAIEPAIKTPEDLYEFLKKVKALNLKAGSKDVIPLSIPWWAQHHLANMYAVNSSWQYHPEDNIVSGSPFGDANGKEYYQFLNKLYNEQLLDPDFSIQKDEQLKEKQASGQVAVSLVLMDPAGANTGIDKIAPGKMFHPIPMPGIEGVKRNGIDAFNPATYQFFLKKDFKDIPRLLKYFDWFFSDEALDLKVWGPESLGLWEMKGDKKVFKDEALHQALIESQDGSIADEQYYKKGLGQYTTGSKQYSKAFGAAPGPIGYNPFDWQRSYPYKVSDIFSLAMAYVTTSALERDGNVLSGVDDATNAPGNWLWSDFYNNKAAKLYAVKPADFDKNWETLKKEFLSKTKYEEAQAAMTAVFKERGLMK